eukprot:3682341-Prymnesium_polylepis.1
MLEKDKPVSYDCPVGAPSSQDAYHRCALFALLQINPTIQHHRVVRRAPTSKPHGKAHRGRACPAAA